MRYSQSAAIDPESTNDPVSLRQLRLWSAPQLIMVLTNLLDELTRLPHAMFQARQSGARILLVHVVGARRHVSTLSQAPLPGFADRQHAARSILDRIAQQLRWVGISCEPIVLTGSPEVEIPRLAKARGVDRLILGFEDSPDLTTSRSGTLIEQILPVMDIPVCVIGRHASLSLQNGLKIRHVTLAVSLDSNCQVHVGFASRLAQEAHASLSILHVVKREQFDLNTASRTAVEAASRLPYKALQEAELFCPTKISIREGDPTEEILRHNSANAGPIVLCSSGAASASQIWRNTVSYRILARAQYPVFILQKRSPMTEVVKFQEKAPAVGNSSDRGERSREEVFPGSHE